MQSIGTNSTNIQQKLCLATVSSKDYWPGTYVMIKSFLKHNTWFKGDIVVISSDSGYLKKKLAFHFKNILVIEPSAELTTKIDKIILKAGYLNLIRDRFLKFEIFRLENYDKIIYYDSDILHIKGIPEIIVLRQNFYASSDPAFIRGFYRNRKTMQKIAIGNYSEKYYPQFVNSGFLIIGSNFLNSSLFKTIIETMGTIDYSDFEDKLADEPVLNALFEKNLEIAPQLFNCSVHLIAEGFIKDDICSVHFTGINKPWKIISWIRLIRRSTVYFKYLKNWLSVYLTGK
jgi:lipopolysaccharide biosynthesis glycosyltransferase